MIKFKEYEFLLNYIGFISKADFKYAENVLSNFLSNESSNISNEPVPTFTLEFEDVKYTLSVTSKHFNLDYYQKYYWIIDVSLPGETWKDVKHILKHSLYTDEKNFNKKGKGIFKFDSPFENFSIEGTLASTGDLILVYINDDTIINKTYNTESNDINKDMYKWM